jgi:hypothetical protein
MEVPGPRVWEDRKQEDTRLMYVNSTSFHIMSLGGKCSPKTIFTPKMVWLRLKRRSSTVMCGDEATTIQSYGLLPVILLV